MKLLFLLLVSTLFAAYEDRYEGLPDYAEMKSSNQQLQIIKKFLPQQPMIFEAGAFDGKDSYNLARTFSEGMVISFEPNPARFAQYLERSKDIPNMRGYNLAVNTWNGEVPFFLCWGTGGTDPIFEGTSSLLPASKSMAIHYMGPVIQVPCVCLENWCQENGIDHFDFMWLDLEGFELQFLQSSPRILSTVKVIYTETNYYLFREGTVQYETLKQFLMDEGFIPIAHWYREGLQGNAIFVRKGLL